MNSDGGQRQKLRYKHMDVEQRTARRGPVSSDRHGPANRTTSVCSDRKVKCDVITADEFTRTES